MQKGQLSQKQMELFEESKRISNEIRAAGFDSAANWFNAAAGYMEAAFNAFITKSDAMLKPKAEPHIVHKDKPGPEGVVVSFSPTKQRAYFYVGEEVVRKCRLRVGDRLYLSGESDGEYRLGIIGDGKNAFTLTSAGGAVSYFKVTIPLHAVPFKSWTGRRAVDFLPGIGCVYFKVE